MQVKVDGVAVAGGGAFPQGVLSHVDTICHSRSVAYGMEAGCQGTDRQSTDVLKPPLKTRVTVFIGLGKKNSLNIL